MNLNACIYLVNVTRKTNQVQFPLWMGVLVNTLKIHGMQPKIIDLAPVIPENRQTYFASSIPGDPAIFGFSIVAGNNHLSEVEKYVRIVKERNEQNIIVYGGPLPSAIPEMLLEKSFCDYIIAGEAEFSFPQLISSLRKGESHPVIPGVFYRKDGKIIGQRCKRLLELGKHSVTDYDLFDMDYYTGYLRETGQSFEMMASRGCRGNCSFCYKFCGNGLTFMNLDMLMDEIEKVINRFGINKIYFVDENFLESRDYFLEFIRKKQQRKLNFTFIGQGRLDSITEEILAVGQQNGLTCISSGIESHSEETLRRINKGMSVKTAEEKMRLVRQHGVLLLVGFIIGFPWDTEETFKELENFILRNELQKRTKIHYLTPLPGTRLIREAVAKGYIRDEYEYIRNLGDLYWERMINMTTLPDKLLDYYYNRLYEICAKDVVYPRSEKYLKQLRKIH